MISTRKKLALVAAATAAVGATLTLGLAGSPAGADPKQYTAFVGVGSDTSQDVMNAQSGFNDGFLYTPARSNAASGFRQLTSWDATPAGSCITTKTGAPVIARPNGSSAGRRAISRIVDGTTYGSPGCGGLKSLSGLVDFARSSAPPAAGDTGTALTYIPFARDALSFGYYRPSAAGPAVTDLTPAQLTSLFSTGPAVIGGVVVVPCGIQLSSGTKAQWDTALGINAATELVGVGACNSLPTGDANGRLQESNGVELKNKGDAAQTQSNPACDGVAGGPAVSCAGVQVVIGYSAASFVARSNGLANPAPPAGVGIGRLSGVAAVNGAVPNLTPNAPFYTNATFGRDIFNVLPTEIVDDTGNIDVQSMFVGPDSGLCTNTAEAITTQFGFLTLGASCGSTALKGSLISGTL